MTLEQVEKRLKEIDVAMNEIIIEKHQLLGYRQRILDEQEPKKEKK